MGLVDDEPVIQPPAESSKLRLERLKRLKLAYLKDLNPLGLRLIDRAIAVTEADLAAVTAERPRVRTKIVPIFEETTYFEPMQFPQRPDSLGVDRVSEVVYPRGFASRLSEALNAAATIFNPQMPKL